MLKFPLTPAFGFAPPRLLSLLLLNAATTGALFGKSAQGPEVGRDDFRVVGLGVYCLLFHCHVEGGDGISFVVEFRPEQFPLFVFRGRSRGDQ